MKGENINTVFSPKHHSQDNCPPQKPTRRDSEISLETLEILLTSVPNEEITLTSDPVFEADNLSSHLQNIQKVINHKKHYLKRLQHLKKKKRGAEWLYRNLSYFQTQFPWELISLLENMSHSKTPEITCKTLKPINELNQRNIQDTPYQENIIGKLEGLEILTTNIRRLIFNSLEDPLNKLSEQLIANCDHEEISIWNDWCINIESHLQHVDELLFSGQNFFSIRNFRLMEQLPISQRSKTALQSIIDKVTPVE